MKTQRGKCIIALLLMILSALVPLSVLAQGCLEKGDWKSYERNHSILGFTIDKTPMKELFAYYGDSEFSQLKDSHGLRGVCFKSPDEKMYIVFKALDTHENLRLYSFQMSASKPEIEPCSASKQLEKHPKTPDGIGLYSTRDDVLKKLGRPTKEDGNTLEWTFAYCENRADVIIKQYGSMIISFKNRKVVNFEVLSGDPEFMIRLSPVDLEL
jgi:hypothetical protein